MRPTAIRSRCGNASTEAGGQIDLALAAPDKEDVSGVWTYRVAALEQLDVPIRTGIEPTVERIRAYRPDLIVIATGAVPRDAPFPVNTNVPMIQAWDVLRRPELIPEGSSVTVIGGGMVGIETAECIAKRASHVTILEGQSVVAKEMARNNRWDVLLRLRDAKAQIVTGAPVVSIEGDTILCRSGAGHRAASRRRCHRAGDRRASAARRLATCRRGRRAMGHGGRLQQCSRRFPHRDPRCLHDRMGGGREIPDSGSAR